MVEIVAAGHLCLDLLPEMSHVLLGSLASPGKLFNVNEMDISTGGAVSNTGLALHRLGVDVGLMGTVGDDLLGQLILAFLEKRQPHLSEQVKIQKGQVSSYTIVLSPENSDRIFLHCTGTNSSFGVADVDFDLVAQAKIFHLGYPPLLPHVVKNDGEELIAIYEKARATGVITSLDMALPDPNGFTGKVNWPKIVTSVLPYVDVFIPSIEEIFFMMRRDQYNALSGDVMGNLRMADLHDLSDELLGYGAAVVGFKLGHKGFYVRTTANEARAHILTQVPIQLDEWLNVEIYHPAFKVEVAGTTGAGDAAYGGFLTALLRGKSASEAVRIACAVGACNVEAADSTSGVRTWEETLKRLDAGWDVRPECIE